MSIIYEALKKTQQTRITPIEITELKKPKSKTFFKIIKYFLLSIILISTLSLIVIYAIFMFQNYKKPTHAKPSAEKISLSGVFISDEEKMAMINNRMMHIGDMVAGAKITAIDNGGVTLNNGEARLTLH